MAKTITLKDPVTREPQYPVTTASNVYDENGNAIPSRLPTIEAREFLVKEYENSLNLFDTYAKSGSFSAKSITYTANSDGTITMNGTSTSEAWVEIAYAFKEDTESRTSRLFSLEKGKTYTFGIIQISGSYSGDINIIMQHTSSTNTGSIQIGNPKVFNDGDGIYRMWINAKSGVSCSNLKIGVMVVEGSELPSKYYPYVNGAIVHQKNLDGVLLWQNGTPSNQISTLTISVSNLSYFSKIRIVYSTYVNYTGKIDEFDLKYGSSKISQLQATGGSGNTKAQRNMTFDLSNSTIKFEEAKANGGTDNGFLIPLAIYGIK